MLLRKSLSLGLLIVWLTGCTSSSALPNQALAGDIVQDHSTQLNSVAGHLSSNSQQVVQASTSTAPSPTLTLPPKAAQPKKAPLQAVPTSTKAPEATVVLPPASTLASPAVGPDQFPEGVNPLTGLPVKDPNLLKLSPALVSITNFPVTARPQAGLSFSPFVFELYIGEGMTRFLALFYGDFPQKTSGVSATNDGVGPIRSGRLPYESLRQLFNGFLVMASASSNVQSTLNSYVNVFGSDQNDINSALIPVTQLKAIAAKEYVRLDPLSLTGLKFDPQPAQGGKLANMVYLPWSYLNQVIWRYDQVQGSYLRWQDNADGVTYAQMNDRLTGKPLAFSNVVILFADHHARAETLIDIDLMYINKRPALLFRDGKMYEIYWTTANGPYEKTTGRVRPIRFVDALGNTVALKPGQTWVELIPPLTSVNETVDPGTYFDRVNKVTPGSGNWVIHFYAPKIESR